MNNEMNQTLVNISMKMQELLAERTKLEQQLHRNIEQEHELARMVSNAYALNTVGPWHPASEVPEDGYYIVKLETGQKFVSQPIAGKWLHNVVEWMNIPE